MAVGGTKCHMWHFAYHTKFVAVTSVVVKVERGGIYARRLATAGL